MEARFVVASTSAVATSTKTNNITVFNAAVPSDNSHLIVPLIVPLWVDGQENMQDH